MMNYENFIEVVAEKFMDYMPTQYKDMKLDIRPVDKVNVTLDGMNLIGDGAKDNILFQLVNTEQNKEMLQDTPNGAFKDLSIIYR